MKLNKIIWLTVAIIIGIVIVGWVSAEYRDEVKAFLRALARAF